MNGRLRLRNPTLLPWLQLVRLPNVFTAMADVAMGFLFVRTISGPTGAAVLGLLVAASSALYAAGMVLNDVFDLPIDARQRPERPLPSGRIAPAAARALGWALLALGLALAWAAASLLGNNRPGLVACLLAAMIVLYDGLLKRTPLGPPAMGACRMLNVLLGMSVVSAAGVVPFGPAEWLAAGGIGVYVAGVTWFARSEAGPSDSRQLAMATVVMLVGVLVLGCFPRWIDRDRLILLLQREPRRWDVFMSLLAAWVAWRGMRAVLDPRPLRVQLVVKQCIVTLVFLDAAACLAIRGPVPAAMILLLLVPMTVLGRWVYST
jgi:hypothetical protein